MAKARRRKKRKGRAYHPKSGSKHWNTREYDLYPVRRLYRGVIHLDPCSNSGSIVRALTEWTEADNGLIRRWFGNVFINPPFGRELIEWFAHGVQEHVLGYTDHQTWLVPSRTDTLWYHAFVLQADAICTVRGRTSFRGAKDQAPFPIIFVYYGPDREGFRQRFAHRGDVRFPSRQQRLKAQRLARMFGLMSAQPSKDLSHLLGLLTIGWDIAKDLTLEELLVLIQHARAQSEGMDLAAVPMGVIDEDPDPGHVPEPSDAPPPHVAPAAKKSTKKAAKKTGAKKGGAKKSAKPKAPKPAKKAPPKAEDVTTSPHDAVAKLDAMVTEAVRSMVGAQFGDIRPKIPETYNDQQVRRSLVRLNKRGVITADGVTRTRTYAIAA